MKSLYRVLPILLAASLALPSYAQQSNGSVAGRVIGRDGQTPVQGALIWIDSLFTESGRLRVRERLDTKTNRDGRFSMSGLYVGRVKLTVVVDGQPVMSKGEAIGDEIFLVSGSDTFVNFDLSKAPATPPPTPAAAVPDAPTGGLSDKEKAELREKLEKEAAARGLMEKAFEAGKAAYAAKNYDDAITNFKSAIDKIPVPTPPGVADILWANLAKTHEAKKEWVEAIAAYKKAIEYKPTDSNYYLNLSLAQIGAGQLAESETSIAKASELNPQNAGAAYYNMGATLINRNQYAEALVFLKKSIEKDPKYANSYYQAGLTLVGMGQMADAQGYLEKYLELVPKGQDSDTARALIDATKAAAPTSFTSPEAEKKASGTKAPAKAPAKSNKQ